MQHAQLFLSGGYEDDLDELDFVLYTGHGGQKNKVQVADKIFLPKEVVEIKVL